MQSRTLLAVVLSFLIFMVFTYLGEKFGTPTLPKAPVPETAEPAKPAPPPGPAPQTVSPGTKTPSPAPAATSARPAREVVVETDLFRAVFTEQGASLKSFQLKKYWQDLPFETIYKFGLGPVGFELERYQDPGKTGAKPKELVTAAPNQELPLSLTWEGRGQVVPATLPYEASATSLTVKGDESATLIFRGATPGGLALTKTYHFRAQNYAFDLKAVVANRSSQTLEGDLKLALTARSTPSGHDTEGVVVSADRNLEEFKAGKLKEPKTFASKVEWAGLDELYFLTVAVPVGAPRSQAILIEPAPTQFKATLSLPETVAPGQEIQAAYAFYFGPKDASDLQAANLGLGKALNFGWFDLLARPFLYFLKWLNGYVHNYGWSLVILTILLRLVFWYPNHKSFISMKVMQKIQPRVAEIREKHKDDREAMNRELMSLYRTFKVNPLGGCLPMVLQLPVFIALYNLLSYAIEMRHASFIPTIPFTNIVWLADLSVKDPLLITPIVMGASMFVQQKMSPSPGDPTQAKMMMFLPLIFTFLFLNFAAGLVIYWLVNNILAIIQQYFTNKYIQ